MASYGPTYGERCAPTCIRCQNGRWRHSMTERTQLLKSLATTIADYRTGELAPPTLDHIERWVCQFTGDVQIPLLRELDYVLKKTYFTRSSVDGFLGNLVRTDKLAGAHPCAF